MRPRAPQGLRDWVAPCECSLTASSETCSLARSTEDEAAEHIDHIGPQPLIHRNVWSYDPHLSRHLLLRSTA